MSSHQKPLILVADADAAAAERQSAELENLLGDRYEIVHTGSEKSASTSLRRAHGSGQPVAMVIACVKFADLFEEAARIDPLVRRVASSSRADREAALEAAATGATHEAVLNDNDFALDLGPTAERLLAEWSKFTDPAHPHVLVIGRSWSPKTHDAGEFLDLWDVPHTVLDLNDRDALPFRDQLKGTAGPLIVRPGQWSMLRPEPRDLALALGLTHAAKRPVYDVAVIGGGPAGLALGTTLAAEGLSTVVLERNVPGGQASRSSKIWNYPGFPGGIAGRDLMANSLRQARELGAEIMAPYEVTELDADEECKRVVLDNGQEVFARAVVIATGAEWRKLEATNVDNLVGAGVYYGGSVSSIPDIAGKEVVVVGGANSAGQAALKLAESAAKVHVLVRGDTLEDSMSAYLINSIEEQPKIEMHYNAEVTAAVGSTQLMGVAVRDRKSGKEYQLDTNHLLVYIGATPRTQGLEKTVALEGHGYVLTGNELEREQPGSTKWCGLNNNEFATSAEDVWCEGDVRSGAVRRVATAVGDAARLAATVFQAIDAKRDRKVELPAKPEVARVALPATTMEEARTLLMASLDCQGYELEVEGPDSWTLTQPSQGARGDHLAQVRITSAGRGQQRTYALTLTIPQEQLIGTAEQRHNQAVAWARGLENFIGLRAPMVLDDTRRRAAHEAHAERTRQAEVA
jgi:thioredoxin reductase (NADPH)